MYVLWDVHNWQVHLLESYSHQTLNLLSSKHITSPNNHNWFRVPQKQNVITPNKRTMTSPCNKQIIANTYFFTPVRPLASVFSFFFSPPRDYAPEYYKAILITLNRNGRKWLQSVLPTSNWYKNPSKSSRIIDA